MAALTPLQQILPIVAAIRDACDPRRTVARAVRQSPLAMQRPAVIAVGKAAPAMLEGFLDASPGDYEKIMVVPQRVPAPKWAIVADHPFPTERCMAAAQRVARFTSDLATGSAGHDGFVLLLSGGASSLLTWPAADLPLEQYGNAIRQFISAGFDIRLLNCIRKHCERLKGGRLGLLMHPLPCVNLILSDVVGDDLSTIGSGPTVADPTTFLQAHVESRHWSEHTVVGPYLREGQLGRHPETPKPGDERLDGVSSIIVGSNALAVQAAVEFLCAQGCRLISTQHNTTGDAAETGRALAHAAMSAPKGSATIWGGETTVNAASQGGVGGRNQELALAAALQIESHPNITIATFATDGVDGPTDAAGAFVSGDTCRQARRIGFDAAKALARHDSYTFFDALERAGFPHLIRTGPTGTNVNDVAIALVH